MLDTFLRKKMKVYAVGFFICIFFAVITSAQSRESQIENNDLKFSLALAITEENSQTVFRNVMYSYLKETNYPDERIQQAIFLQPPELASESDYTNDADAGFDLLRKKFSHYRPSDIYNYGKKTSFQKIENPISVFDKSGPVTIVIVPGIFGEFIENRPFEEALDRGSFYARYHQILSNQKTKIKSLAAGCDIVGMGPEEAKGNYLSGGNIELKSVQVSLDQAVSLGSIDDANGEPVINVILLRPGVASLETLGTIESNTETYLPRLNQIFEVLPSSLTKNIYIMGYSRGGAVALDLVVKAWEKRKNYPWIKRVQGVIGLGGVFYGSEVADDAVSSFEKTVNSKAIQTINWLGNELRLTDAIVSGWGMNNNAKWAQAITEFAKLAPRMGVEQPEGARIESTVLQLPMLDLAASGHLIWNLAGNQLHLRDPTDYYGNILRFKKFVSEAYLGLQSITIQARLDWWKNHVIPSRFKIYSLVASMPDASSNNQVSSMFDLDYYGLNTADFISSLRGSYYALLSLSGNEFNDSQVTAYSSRYWPKFTQTLSPYQPLLKSYFMGTVGTHHWGMSFPIASKQANGAVNPFPRMTFLKSIGTFLAMTQKAP